MYSKVNCLMKLLDIPGFWKPQHCKFDRTSGHWLRVGLGIPDSMCYFFHVGRPISQSLFTTSIWSIMRTIYVVKTWNSSVVILVSLKQRWILNLEFRISSLKWNLLLLCVQKKCKMKWESNSIIDICKWWGFTKIKHTRGGIHSDHLSKIFA